jgi:ABC-type multidrug transport system permease subunit
MTAKALEIPPKPYTGEKAGLSRAYDYLILVLTLFLLTLAVVGPFMILVSVGFNEWGHTFWFREEFFAAPIHWGFVLGVWFALGVSGILLQQVSRLIQLLDQIEDAA